MTSAEVNNRVRTDELADPIGTPEILYHYTNESGLLGILQSRHLWATAIEYLNDSAELVYAREELAHQAWAEIQRLCPGFDEETEVDSGESAQAATLRSAVHEFGGLDPIPLTLKNWTPKVQKGVSTWPIRQSSDGKPSVSTESVSEASGPARLSSVFPQGRFEPGCARPRSMKD